MNAGGADSEQCEMKERKEGAGCSARAQAIWPESARRRAPAKSPVAKCLSSMLGARMKTAQTQHEKRRQLQAEVLGIQCAGDACCGRLHLLAPNVQHLNACGFSVSTRVFSSPCESWDQGGREGAEGREGGGGRLGGGGQERTGVEG
jgi:uncharacterized membrane protein YgcG